MTTAIIIVLVFVLTVREFAHGQGWQEVLITAAREGMQDFHQKQNEITEALKELHRDLEHVKGTVNNIQGSLQRQQQLGSSPHQKISGVVSFLETGGIDIDECAQGKAECSPHATCRNSVGGYSCSCNPPFEGDGRTCEFSCERPAREVDGAGCVKLVDEPMTWQQMNATCQEEGWRLLQDFDGKRLRDVGKALSFGGLWIGVYNGKWHESGFPIQEELWEFGVPTDPTKRCGVIVWGSGSGNKVKPIQCSDKLSGYCQVPLNKHQKSTLG